MKNVRLLAILSLAVLLLSGCKKSDDAPYITLTDASGNSLSSTAVIPVALNSTLVLHSEIGYEGTPRYEWKIDDKAFESYSMDDGLNIHTIGSHNNLKIQKATLTVHFGQEIVQSGSTVVIRLSDEPNLSRSVTFKVE